MRNILEISTVAEGQNNRLKKYEEELGQIRERIQTYKDKISLNEQELGKLQNELKEKQEKLRIGQTAYHRESSCPSH